MLEYECGVLIFVINQTSKKVVDSSIKAVLCNAIGVTIIQVQIQGVQHESQQMKMSRIFCVGLLVAASFFTPE